MGEQDENLYVGFGEGYDSEEDDDPEAILPPACPPDDRADDSGGDDVVPDTQDDGNNKNNDGGRQHGAKTATTRSSSMMCTDWDARVRRNEVYDVAYAPSAEEEREVKDLARVLGVPGSRKGRPRANRRISALPLLASILHPQNDDEPRSIVLMRGTVTVEVEHHVEPTNAGGPSARRMSRTLSQRQVLDEEKELILLTNAFVLVSRIKNILAVNKNRVEACENLASIQAVLDLSLCSHKSLNLGVGGAADPNALAPPPHQRDSAGGQEEEDYSTTLRIAIESGTVYSVNCPSPDTKDSWLQAFTGAVIAAKLRNGQADTDIGWRHRVARTSVYSASLLGDEKMLRKIVLGDNKDAAVMIPDESGYWAIHYAAMNNHNDCLSILLGAGADPLARNIDQMSPLDYARKNDNEDALEILDAYGARMESEEKEEDVSELRQSNSDGSSCEQGAVDGAMDVLGIGKNLESSVSTLGKRGKKLVAGGIPFGKKRSDVGGGEVERRPSQNDDEDFANEYAPKDTSPSRSGSRLSNKLGVRLSGRSGSTTELQGGGSSPGKNKNRSKLGSLPFGRKVSNASARSSYTDDPDAKDGIDHEGHDEEGVDAETSPDEGMHRESPTVECDGDDFEDVDLALNEVDPEERTESADPFQAPKEYYDTDLADWKCRVDREEVYDENYAPTAEEEEEIKSLARFLGVGDGRMSMSKKRPPEMQTLYPLDHEPRSILLQRGPVLLDGATSGQSNGGQGENLKEFILLTNAILVAALGNSNGGKGLLNARNKLMKKKFEDCILLTSVVSIADLSLHPRDKGLRTRATDAEKSLEVELEDRSLTVVCSTADEKDLWLQALAKALIGANLRSDKDQMIGWIHLLLRTSGYSAALLGKAEMLSKLVTHGDFVDKGDATGYWAIHYAAMERNVGCISILLDAGSDPNKEDRDYMTPVDYASRNRDWKSLKVLADAGGALTEEDQKWVAQESELSKWDTRLSREEIYGKDYVPSAEEEREINELARSFGVGERRQLSKKRILSIASMLNPPEMEPRPVLLKRGFLRIGSVKAGRKIEKEKELILLTNAFILETPADIGSPMLGKKLMKKEKCEYLDSILAVMDLELCSYISLDVHLSKKDLSDDEENESDEDSTDSAYGETSFRVAAANRSYTLMCSSAGEKKAWVDAFRLAVVGAHLRLNPHKDKDEIGWQHRIIRASVYSAAVCNDDDMLYKILKSRHKGDMVDSPDNAGYAASHYAAMNGHHQCLAALLDEGADPDNVDDEMFSPVDYASKLRDRRALEMLQASGGNISEEDKDWMEEEEREEISQRREASKGSNTAGTMAEVKDAFNERGERLKALQGRTSDLVDAAANYKDMATQLKQETKEKGKIFGRF